MLLQACAAVIHRTATASVLTLSCFTDSVLTAHLVTVVVVVVVVVVVLVVIVVAGVVVIVVVVVVVELV